MKLVFSLLFLSSLDSATAWASHNPPCNHESIAEALENYDKQHHHD